MIEINGKYGQAICYTDAETMQHYPAPFDEERTCYMLSPAFWNKGRKD